jgi:RND superfamily putative drug exporter
VFAALGRFSYRWRWWVIAVWSVLFLLAIASLPFLGGVLRGGGFSDSGSASEHAARFIEQRLGTGFTTLQVVFTAKDEEATSAAFQALQRTALAKLTPGSLPALKQVLTYASSGSQFISKDKHSSVAVLVFSANKYAVQSQVQKVRRLLVPTRLQAFLTGEPAVNADLTRTSEHDLKVAESYAVPIALLALVLVFGTLVAAALPVISGGMAVTVTLGAVFLLGKATTMSIFVMNTASLLGLAVGIDYALFVVARFREELDGGREVADAVEATVARAGRSVFFSGLAVAIGILGLAVFPFPAFRSIGIGGALVVFFSMAAAETLLPALLGVLGPRVNAVRIVRVPTGPSRFWTWWSSWVLRWPWAALLVSIGLIALFASPVIHMRMQMPTAAVLPPSAESRKGYDILTSQFDMGVLSPISVALDWQGDSSAFTPARLASLYAFGRQLEAEPGVASVQSVATLSGVDSGLALLIFWQAVRPALQTGAPVAVGSTHLSASQVASLQQLVAGTTGKGIVVFRVVPTTKPSSSAASNLVARLRAITPPAGTHLSVAGESAGRLDFFQGLRSRFPWMAASVLLATYVVLVLLTGSLVAPLKAIIVNACTIAIAYGTIVFLFQDGHLQSLLHFTSTGAVDATTPIVMFCALFGVSMDYEVFLLARMHETWHDTHDAAAAVAAGLTRSGRVIVSAAALVVVVTGSFAFTTITITKTLGIGIAVAIALDALLVRMMLAPALMRMLGRWVWWMPARLSARVPDLSGD